MLKPVSLAVLGISIVVAGVSLGVTLTRYLGLRAYSPKGATQASPPPAGRGVPATPPEEWNNLFAPADGMKMASRLAAADAKGAAQATRTRFVLVGTIVSSTPSARRAILWADGMKAPKAYREKEEVEPGAILAAVQRDKAWIARGKEREKLEILPVGSRARPTGAVAPGVVPSVAAAAPTSTSPGHVPPLPGIAPAPPPAGAQAVAAPGTSSGDEEEEQLTARERRRRSRRVGR